MTSVVPHNWQRTVAKTATLCYTWNVQGFGALRKLSRLKALPSKDRLFSPEFGTKEAGFWKVALFPYGDRDTGKHVSLYLFGDKKQRRVAEFSMVVLDKEFREIPDTFLGEEPTFFTADSNSWGWHEFLSVDNDDELKPYLVDNDNLRVKIVVKVYTGVVDEESPRVLFNIVQSRCGESDEEDEDDEFYDGENAETLNSTSIEHLPDDVASSAHPSTPQLTAVLASPRHSTSTKSRSIRGPPAAVGDNCTTFHRGVGGGRFAVQQQQQSTSAAAYRPKGPSSAIPTGAAAGGMSPLLPPVSGPMSTASAGGSSNTISSTKPSTAGGRNYPSSSGAPDLNVSTASVSSTAVPASGGDCFQRGSGVPCPSASSASTTTAALITHQHQQPTSTLGSVSCSSVPSFSSRTARRHDSGTSSAVPHGFPKTLTRGQRRKTTSSVVVANPPLCKTRHSSNICCHTCCCGGAAAASGGGRQRSIIPGSEEVSIHGRSLSHDIASFALDPRVQNLTIVCGGQKFRCNRFVLAARSDVFRAMLFGQYMEASQDEIVIHDVQPDCAEDFLTFVATDNCSALDLPMRCRCGCGNVAVGGGGLPWINGGTAASTGDDHSRASGQTAPVAEKDTSKHAAAPYGDDAGQDEEKCSGCIRGKDAVCFVPRLLNLLAVADKYHVLELRSRCIQSLARCVCVRTVLDILDGAEALNCDTLADACQYYLKNNAGKMDRIVEAVRRRQRRRSSLSTSSSFSAIPGSSCNGDGASLIAYRSASCSVSSNEIVVPSEQDHSVKGAAATKCLSLSGTVSRTHRCDSLLRRDSSQGPRLMSSVGLGSWYEEDMGAAESSGDCVAVDALGDAEETTSTWFDFEDCSS